MDIAMSSQENQIRSGKKMCSQQTAFNKAFNSQQAIALLFLSIFCDSVRFYHSALLFVHYTAFFGLIFCRFLFVVSSAIATKREKKTHTFYPVRTFAFRMKTMKCSKNYGVFFRQLEVFSAWCGFFFHCTSVRVQWWTQLTEMKKKRPSNAH